MNVRKIISMHADSFYSTRLSKADTLLSFPLSKVVICCAHVQFTSYISPVRVSFMQLQ